MRLRMTKSKPKIERKKQEEVSSQKPKVQKRDRSMSSLRNIQPLLVSASLYNVKPVETVSLDSLSENNLSVSVPEIRRSGKMSFDSTPRLLKIQRDLLGLFQGKNDIPPMNVLVNHLKVTFPLIPFSSVISTEGDNIIHLAVRRSYSELDGLLYSLSQILGGDGEFLSQTNVSGNTPLHVAVVRNNFQAVRILLKHRFALMYEVNKKKQTPLHLIGIFGGLDALAVLLELAKQQKQPVPVSSLDFQANTVYHLASIHKHAAVIHLLPPNPVPEIANCFGAKVSDFLGPSVHEGENPTPEFSLLQSLKASDYDAIGRLLEANPHLQTTRFPICRNGNAIHCAFRFHALGELPEKAVALLLEKGVAHDVSDDDGNMPLHISATQPRSELASLILERSKKEDMSYANKDGNTVFHMVAYSGYQVIADLLFTRPFDSDALSLFNSNRLTCLHIACNGGHTEMAARMINSSLIGALTEHGETALHIATRRDALDLVKLLVSAAPSLVNTCDSFGRTPLLTAASFFAVGSAMYLLERNRTVSEAKLNLALRDSDGLTAFQMLISSDLSKTDPTRNRQELYYKLLGEFISQGADIEASIEHVGMSPLMVAAANNQIRTARFLMENGARATSINYFKDTALHFAAENQSPELVSLLLQHR